MKIELNEVQPGDVIRSNGREYICASVSPSSVSTIQEEPHD